MKPSHDRLSPGFEFSKVPGLRIRPLSWFALIAVIAFSLLISSCRVLFVAPYDETTDRLLTDLSVKTQTAIARADAGKLSEDERAKFFDEALGTVRTMKERSSLFPKNEEEVKALTQLEQRYQNLREHGSSPRTSLTTGLRATLLDVQQIQVAKKRSSIFSASLGKSKSSQ
jgi:hypothetical protein